jgi:hypothetical protein
LDSAEARINVSDTSVETSFEKTAAAVLLLYAASQPFIT